MMFAVFLFLIGVNYAWSESCSYAQFSPSHTMCFYIEPACPLMRQGVTEDDIEVILDVHNKLRSKAATGNQEGQPEAANMKQLTWDPELAEIAQRLAEQCVLKHEGNADRRSFGFEEVGQNIGLLQNSNPIPKTDFKRHIENWFYKEVINMEPSYIDDFPESTPRTIGHYTQVVWAETAKVGCGMTYYKKGNWYTTELVCNYGPAGNGIGESIYKVGQPCSQCTNGCSDNYDGLCL